MDFSVMLDSLPLYVEGLWTTFWLVGLALIIGLIIAVPAGIARTSSNAFINFPVWCYSYFFRGTPLLVQLYLIYYGSSQFMEVRGTLWEHAWFCALFAFVLNTGAYTAEIFAGAIKGLDKGEIEASKAYGMSVGKMYRRIILPSAFRRALPAYSNEVIFVDVTCIVSSDGRNNRRIKVNRSKGFVFLLDTFHYLSPKLVRCFSTLRN